MPDDAHLLVFEDITEIVSAQRAQAWGEVARRLAHEIKNPLTPIQLSAERLKRKYGRVITVDREVFDQCTDTIVRQVDDIKRMVDEFSSFARLPKPVFRAEDPVDLARQAVFLQEVARPDLSFGFSVEDSAEGGPPLGRLLCDRHQFGQAMTNVLKNAVEAIEARSRSGADPDYRGAIRVAMRGRPNDVQVSITDNGIGLPQERERITEPYMTTREKGTGLGLAIVKKIVEEHGGEMSFASGSDGGTVVTMTFARDPVDRAQTPRPEAAE